MHTLQQANSFYVDGLAELIDAHTLVHSVAVL